MRHFIAPIATASLLLVVPAQRVHAQRTTDPIFAGELAPAGRAGITAANAVQVGRAGGLMFVGGTALGISLLFIAAAPTDPGVLIGTLGGVSLTVVGVKRIETQLRHDASAQQQLANLDAPAKAAFEKSYKHRLMQRARNRWIVGFIAGGVGVGLAVAAALSGLE